MKIKTIIQNLDRPTLIDRLGVDTRSISAAISGGSFPASWYSVVQSLADEKGVEVPDSLFNFKRPVVRESIQEGAA